MSQVFFQMNLVELSRIPRHPANRKLTILNGILWLAVLVMYLAESALLRKAALVVMGICVLAMIWVILSAKPLEDSADAWRRRPRRYRRTG